MMQNKWTTALCYDEKTIELIAYSVLHGQGYDDLFSHCKLIIYHKRSGFILSWMKYSMQLAITSCY